MGLLHSLRVRIGRAPGRRPALRRSRCRPRLEVLEGRCLPSTVTTLNDAGPGSLRQALLDTPAGGTVDFQPGLSGTISLTTGELVINSNLTVAGPGADAITVSGNHASRVFNILGTANVAISALTIADGRSSGFGGGIRSSGTLTLTDSVIRDNTADDDAGVSSFGTLTVTGCTVIGNSTSAGGFGGGIDTGFGAATITDSVISGNFATDGAGVVSFGTTTINRSTISDNFATLSGTSFGGGVYNSSGTLTVINSTISGNATTGTGGGIINFAQMSITNSTVSGNSAANILGGGGIKSFSGALTIRNTIVAGNTAAPPDIAGVITSQGHNLIGDGTGGSGYDPTDLVGTAASPIDPLLAPLHDNGGPTPTLALLPGSPAIDAGDNTDAPAFDQRGPGFPRVANGTVDIGAFEAPENPVTGGFDASALPPCDDCSSGAVPLGFTFDFYGQRFDSAFVNNNGNLTFDGPFTDFAPAPLAGTGRAILAPFWADVYTLGGGNGRVTYGTGALDGDPAFGATWEAVAPFLPHGATDTFQVVIADHTARLGYYEVQFNYLSLGWDRPDSSDQPPRAGFSNGAGAAQELPGSGMFDALTDTGGSSLRVLRRYTLILYPGQTGSLTPGDTIRLAWVVSPEGRATVPAAEIFPERFATPLLPAPVAEFGTVPATPPVVLPLGRAAARRDVFDREARIEDGVVSGW